MCCPGSTSASAGATRWASSSSSSRRGGRLVISGDCVYSRRQISGHNNDGVYVPLNNAVGSVWDQLKTIDRINGEIDGDLSRLIILHDVERWPGLPVVKEVEGFRIVKVA